MIDERNNKRHHILIYARVNFSQSETSWLLFGGGWGFKILGTTGAGEGGGGQQKISEDFFNVF